MMTLDEAIKHCNEVACKHDECATEHKQLAQWLMELKGYKEQKPANEVGNYDHKEVLQTIINEQNPAWSEEDERISSNINLYIRKAGDYPHFGKENIKEAINWFNSLKDRVQTNQKKL